MSQRRRYIVLVSTSNGTQYDRVLDYIKYATCNYVIADPEAFIIDSYLSPRELVDELMERMPGSGRCFAAEITGEATWRNASCGFDAINRFLDS